MSEGKKINDAATVSGLPEGGFILVADSGGGLKRLSVDALLADVRGSVKVGGRNLALGTSTPYTKSNSTAYPLTSEWQDMLVGGTPITVSFEYEYSGVTITDTKSARIGAQASYKNMGGWSAYVDAWHYLNGATSGKGRFSRTEILKENPDIFSKAIGVYIQGISGGTAKIFNVKLERGNVATDWTPAPEDYMPTNSTSGGVKERPLYALVVTPKGGVRHERGEGADGNRVERHHDECIDEQGSCAGLGRAEKSGDLLCQFRDGKHSVRDRWSRGLQGVLPSSDNRTSGGYRLVGTRYVLADMVADEMGELAQVNHYRCGGYVTTSPEGSATERLTAGKEVAYV